MQFIPVSPNKRPRLRDDFLNAVSYVALRVSYHMSISVQDSHLCEMQYISNLEQILSNYDMYY